MKKTLSTQLFSFIITAIMLFTFSVKAQNTATVSGTVKTSDGKPIEGVSISISYLKLTAMTDNRGEFKINRVPVGTYTITTKYLNLQSQDKEVTIEGGQTAAYADFVMTETLKQLQEVNVLSGKVNKFGDKNSEYVARLPLKNLENPQVYSSVTKELIADQLVVDFKEALRNVPGISPNNNPAGGTGGSIRGFNATTTVRNGLAVQSYQSDPVNIERIEVIKGPSGTLFGSSIVSFGGFVNQVTKKPLDTVRGEVSATIGSYELARYTVDVSTPLNKEKTVLFRINGASHKENSFQNFGFKKMVTIAPSLLYKATDRLTFLFELEMNKTNRSTIAYYQNFNKTTYKSFRDIPIPFDIALSGSNLDAELSATNVYTEAKYKISDSWTSTTSLAYGENEINHSHQIYPQWTGNNKFDRSISSYGPRIFTSLNAQQNFTGDFKIGGLRNRLVAGLNVYTFRSFLRFTATGVYDQIDLGASPIIPGINLEKVNAIIAGKTQTNTENNQNSYSAYASNVLNVTDNLMAMVSLRADRFNNEPSIANGIKAATGGYSQTAFSPKVGLIYQVIKNQVSVFGNYMNGFQNVGPVTQPNGVVDILKPRQANQWEAGLKMEVFNKMLSATFSYYDIKISNDTRLVNTFTIQDATSRSKGFEAEIIANPVTGLNIVAGYASVNYKIVQAASNVGNYQAQSPTNYANFWASYKFSGNFLKNMGFGFGGNYVANSFFDAENTVVIPSYKIINASAFYDQPKWRLTFKGNNLSNQKYWNNYGIAETLRQFLFGVSFKF